MGDGRDYIAESDISHRHSIRAGTGGFRFNQSRHESQSLILDSSRVLSD